MAEDENRPAACAACGQERPGETLAPEPLPPAGLAALIQRRWPSWRPGAPLCRSCREAARADFIEAILEDEGRELESFRDVVEKNVKRQEDLIRRQKERLERRKTFGERVADRVALFGGSWRFIFLFGGVLVAWIILNSLTWLWRPFDPYPYILLNLALSCLAALQAPIIMMSQNRQAANDRAQTEYDYRVDLKAETEIRHLGATLDRLVSGQWRRLLEIQRLQMDLLQEIARASGPQTPPSAPPPPPSGA